MVIVGVGGWVKLVGDIGMEAKNEVNDGNGCLFDIVDVGGVVVVSEVRRPQTGGSNDFS